MNQQKKDCQAYIIHKDLVGEPLTSTEREELENWKNDCDQNKLLMLQLREPDKSKVLKGRKLNR